MRESKRRYVVDVAGLSFQTQGEIFYTTPQVLGEVHGSAKKSFVRAKIERGELLVREAKPRYIEEALSAADSTGDRKVLSESDISLLALFIEMSNHGETTLLTDDYALQNVASSLSLKVKTIFGKKIRDVITWETYCPICRMTYSPDFKGESCLECGSKITRRAVSKR